MHECVGCNKSFEKAGSLNTHKRFCVQWKSLGIKVRKDCISRDDRKNIPAQCPICGKDFDNIYSMSAHKGHCSGKSSTVHFETKRNWSRGLSRDTDERVRKSGDQRAIPLADILDGKHPNFQTHKLKQRLLKENLIENRCGICNITDWMGRPIVCELDHINGNKHDHRLENLRMLCPNCHSQTETYCGKNKGNYK